ADGAVLILDAEAGRRVRRRDLVDVAREQPHEAERDARALDDDARPEPARVATRALLLHVRPEEREPRPARERGDLLRAVIELVVADLDGVVVELVHDRRDEPPLGARPLG